MERGKPTLEDVARAAGTSRSTVSRVVNGDTAVTAELRQRVEKAVTALGYRPDPAARALATGRADIVELVVIGEPASFGSNAYYARVVAGVLGALRGTDVQMRLHVTPAPDTARVLAEVAERAALGVLLVNVPAALAVVLRRHGDRVVSMGRSTPQIAWIDPDNPAGAVTAVRHLYETGRRRIAAIHGPATNPCAIGRRAGYAQAIADAGLQPVTASGLFCRETGVRATHDLLAAHPDLDAIFAGCDDIATGVLQTLAEHGRRVPDDVAVVGFDGSVLAASASPPLSSVCQPVEQLAATATRALLDRQVSADWSRVLPTSLIVRRSSVGSAA